MKHTARLPWPCRHRIGRSGHLCERCHPRGTVREDHGWEGDRSQHPSRRRGGPRYLQAAFQLRSSTGGSSPTPAPGPRTPHGDSSPRQPHAPSPHSGLPPQLPAPHTGPLPHSSPRHFHPTWEPFPAPAPGTRTPFQNSGYAPGCAAGPTRSRPGSHRTDPIPASVCRAWPRPRLLLAASAPPLRRDHNSQRAARPRARQQPIPLKRARGHRFLIRAGGGDVSARRSALRRGGGGAGRPTGGAAGPSPASVTARARSRCREPGGARALV